MKLLALILVFVMKASVVCGQSSYSDLTTIKRECEMFTDSLILAKVDTVISYYSGFAACPTSGKTWAFIYWRQNNISSAAIFEQRTMVRKRKTYDTYELHLYTGAGMPSYSFDYFDRNFANI